MKTITTGFRIPSLREVCEKNDAQRSSDAAAAVQTLAVPYGVGKATLQLTGIHVRLQPLRATGGPNSDSKKTPAPQVTGAIAADIVVHAHVRGELKTRPQPFVIAVIPVRYDAAHNADDASTASPSSSAAAAAAPYDKRVLNAQAREARRGVVAPMLPSAFARVDLRTQMERVRLSFTVVPVGRMSTGVPHRGKRAREEGEEATAATEPALSLVDCLVDVTVVGTVSPIM